MGFTHPEGSIDWDTSEAQIYTGRRDTPSLERAVPRLMRDMSCVECGDAAPPFTAGRCYGAAQPGRFFVKGNAIRLTCPRGHEDSVQLGWP
jgi:hypothetical protein